MNLRAPTADFAAAQRVARLGTETVFAVSAEAAALAAQGKTVYPFHLGDLNLATPENIVEASLRAIRAPIRLCCGRVRCVAEVVISVSVCKSPWTSAFVAP